VKFGDASRSAAVRRVMRFMRRISLMEIKQKNRVG